MPRNQPVDSADDSPSNSSQTARLHRRAFIGGAAAAAAFSAVSASASLNSAQPSMCAFIKFLQSLSYDRLAEEIAKMGFQGIEATVRKGGHVDPQRVEEQLPELVDALKKHGLVVSIMASDINRSDDELGQRVLKTAAKLGVKRYRMRYYRYEKKTPLMTQLDALRPIVRDLASLNAELGLQAVYQNHSGANNVGAPVWDLAELLTGIDPKQIGAAFDIRHATVEGGLSWPLHFRRIEPHLGAIYVKDFVWDAERRRPRNVPLGKGLVDSAFFRQLAKANFSGLMSLHVEYLPKGTVRENLEAIRTDVASLRRLMANG